MIIVSAKNKHSSRSSNVLDISISVISELEEGFLADITRFISHQGNDHLKGSGNVHFDIGDLIFGHGNKNGGDGAGKDIGGQDGADLLDDEQNSHSVKIVGVVLEADDLREQLLLSPLGTQDLGQGLYASNSGFSNTIDSVGKPVNQELEELIIEEVGTHLLGEETQEFDGRGSSSPVLVNSQIVKGRKKGLRKGIQVNNLGDGIQMLEEVNSNIGALISQKEQEDLEDGVIGGSLSNQRSQLADRLSQSSSNVLNSVLSNRVQVGNDLLNDVVVINLLAELSHSGASNSLDLGFAILNEFNKVRQEDGFGLLLSDGFSKIDDLIGDSVSDSPRVILSQRFNKGDNVVGVLLRGDTLSELNQSINNVELNKILIILHQRFNTVYKLSLVARRNEFHKILQVHGGVFSGQRNFIITKVQVDVDQFVLEV
mmetsp:Transcript_58471/g.81102  ORF Transcript_58471/g.81102 Transcript_58471/m.81102 type:complete len:428 (-) Transcript_58471:183-1466(-)